MRRVLTPKRILLPAALLVLGPGLAAAAPAAQITAGSAGDLGQHADVPDGTPLATDPDAGCSLLLDRQALVELCGDTRLALEESPQGNRIVRVDAGDARILAPTLAAGDRIEIHTPAAIATILGTSLHVRVDPSSGDTRITCFDNPVQIASSESGVAGETTCAGGREVVIPRGSAPGRAEVLDPQTLADLSSCFFDYHGAALSSDREQGEKRAVEALLQDDLEPDLPGVGEEPDEFDPGDPVQDDPPIEDATQTEDVKPDEQMGERPFEF